MTRRDPRTRDAEDLIILSQRDIEHMLADAYVDLREVCEDDATAADAVDIVYARLTDDWYLHNEP